MIEKKSKSKGRARRWKETESVGGGKLFVHQMEINLYWISV